MEVFYAHHVNPGGDGQMNPPQELVPSLAREKGFRFDYAATPYTGKPRERLIH